MKKSKKKEEKERKKENSEKAVGVDSWKFFSISFVEFN